MKKGLVVLVSAVLLLFTACDSWMQDDDFYSEIENDVKVANAQQISVYVRYALTRQGKTDPDGSATFKVEIPHEISATTEPEYGFVRWAAFPTSFLATGDNQAKNKDVYFIDDDDYKARLLPHEILAPVVVFENAKSASTKVTINEKRDDIFLVPIVAQRPAVSLTIPAKGSSGVVRNMSVRINFTKPMDPDSFKNEAGEYDKITITQGIQTFSADGDIEINSQDITDRFEAPVFSANQKMVTLRFKQEAIEEGYASQSSVNIIISKDVKDIFGFNMTDDDKISFSVGSSMDTLAPRITFLTAGSTLENFDSFKGMYKDASTWGNITAFTKMDPHQKGSGQTATYLGAKDAPVNNLDSSFYDTFAPPADASNSGYRVTNKIYIHTLAEDIAGSGSNQSQTGLETDVAMLGIRATLMYKADGTVPEEAVTAPTTSVNYMPQSVGQSLVKDYVYKNLVHAINVKNGATSPSDEGYLAEDKGFLFEYDLSSLPDGLIRVDIFAVDMVQNSGLAAGGELSEEYGNGYASLFVVKDTTPPDAAANSGYVIVDTGADSHITADNYFNEVTYPRLKIKSDTSSIVDSGHPRLRSHHDNMKWIVKPTDTTDWVSSIKTTDSSWGAITSNYGPFPTPEASQQGKIFYTYALMDDVGNISNAVGINPIYYDSVAPAVQTPYFVADEGFTAGVARDNILDEQTLVLPITEITSGLKSIEVKVRKNGATADYATPLAADSLNVVAKDKDGNTVPYTVDSAKKVITFNQPITDFDSNVTIKGLKLSDDLDEQGSFEVSVLVKDAAAADSVHETVPGEGAVSNTDSVPVQINTVYIPNIRKTERFGVANSAEFWIDYNASTLTKKAGSNPLTDVYITFQEATSGAKVFDFTNSTISLTGDSMIYKVNASTGAIDGIAIPSTVSGNKLTITSSVDAKNNFANPDGDHKLTVKITNVALADEGTASSVNLKIYDTATNGSTAGTTICSNEGSLNLGTPGISTASFNFDSANPTSAMEHGYLIDRNGSNSDSTATEAIGKTAAEPGYTNEDFINATVTLNPKASGISSVRIDGDASFVSGTTTIKANGTDVSFDISSEGKVVTFKNANGHLALGSGTTAVTLTITNLKLTSGDGTKNVTFLARGFGNVEDTTGSSDSIVLDTVAPVWVNNGLYSAYNSSVTSTTAYPHPISGEKAYGFTGVDTNNPNDLYFYRYSRISIKPDVSDDNPKADNELVDYTHEDNVVNNNNAAYSPESSSYGYTTQTGTFTATAKDKAGNKSTVKKFHIVEDTSFATTDTEKSAIDQYMVLYKPEGAFIHRNKTVTSGEAITEYVIKGDAQYQIRVKLNGASTEEGEETIDKPGTGATQLLTDSYSRKDNTTTSSKIEYYSISVSNYVSDTPSSPSSSDWKAYTADSVSQTYTTNGITSYVNNGTIIINIPNTGSNPLVLWLKDACGNYTHRKIRPTAMAASGSLSAIRWLVDTEIGVTGYKGSLDTSLPSVTKKDDVTFYNDDNTPTFTISGLSESCRFEIGENETVTNVGDENHYSLKSRIIVWTGSGSPTRDDFYADSLTSDKASAWDYRKEAPVEQASLFNDSTDFSVSNTFPKYASSNRYKLFFILEDTVGNYYISQLKRDGSNLTTASSYTTAYWLYDNEAPVVDESSIAFQKVNQVTVGSEVRNYYSGNSTVTYNITDSGSGIYHDGSGTTSYSGFDSRRTAITPKTYTIPSVSDGSAPKLSGIQDYAGNSHSDITLKNGTISKWYYRGSAPVLAGTTSTNKAWAETTSVFGYVTPTLASDSETEGQVLSLKAKSSALSLNVYLSVTDTEELLGWKISPTKLTITGNECYTAADVTQLSYDSTNKRYTYSYVKAGTLNYVSWTDASAGITQTQYFYPVNRAGLVGKPIKVMFVENVRPAITNGNNNNGYTYSSNANINSTYLASDAPETAYTIKAETATPKINYTRNGATVTFTTTQAPTDYKFVYGAGNNGRWGDDDDDAGTLTALSGSGPTYTIPLDSAELQGRTSSASGTPLRIQLSRGTEEDSVVYELNGPAGNNLWVYDNTTPSISFTASSDVKSGSSIGNAPASSVVSSDDTMYIQDANAFIKFTLSNASDIAHFQYKKRTNFTSDTAWSGWTDITSGREDGNLTFAAPAEKTEYMFRAIDTAGNISTATTAVKLQRDDKAPDGTFTYETRQGDIDSSTSTDKKDLTDNGLGAGKGVDNPYGGDSKVRDISYSNSSDSPYYITHIWVDLSKITDKYTSANAVNQSTGIERSGIQNFIIKKNGTTIDTLGSDAASYKINLDGNGASTVVYEVSVTDNINQVRTLQTFRTTMDGTAPVLSDLAIQAKDANGSNASDAVLYPDNSTGVYYLKNTKVYITFNIDDAFATYEWSTTGGSSDSEWHNSNHTEVEASSTSITWNFDAPDEKTTYYFRGTDRVKNTSTPVSFKVQKDMWAPEGNWSYTLHKDDSDEITLPSNLIVEDNSDEGNPTVSIDFSTYSGNSKNINKIKINLSDINTKNDKHNNIERAGIEGFYDGTTKISLEEGYYNFDLPTSGSETHVISVKDNIGNTRILKTFNFTADGTPPSLSETASIQSYPSNDESSISTATAVNKDDGNGSIYYLKNNTAKISFTINDTSAIYKWWKTGDSDWSVIPDDNKSVSGTSFVCTFGTPNAITEYKFKVIDKVGNESPERSFKLKKDYDNPTGAFSYTLKNGDDDASGTFTDDAFVENETANENIRIIKYKLGAVTKLEIDFSQISDADSGIENYYLKVGNSEAKPLSADSNPPLNNTTKKALITLGAVNDWSETYVISVNDNVGHERTLKTITITSDGAAPDLSLASVQTEQGGNVYKDDDDVYFIRGENAILNFTKTHSDIKEYWKKVDDGEWIKLTSETLGFGVNGNSITYQISAPAAKVIYQLKAIDKVGNECNPISVSFVKDVDAPSGSISYKLLNGSEDTPAVDQVVNEKEATETSLATTVIGYNKSAATKIVFTSSITDGTSGSGVKKLTYKINGGSETDFPSDGTISNINADDFANGTTYEIIATDNTGNSAIIKKFELRGVSGGPKVEKEKRPYYSGLHYVPTYPVVPVTDSDNPNKKSGDTWLHIDNWIKAFDKDEDAFYITAGGTDKIDEGTVTGKIFGYNNKGEPTDGDTPNTNPSGYTIRQFKAGTQYRLPVVSTSLPSDKLYYAITYNTCAVPDSWTEKSVEFNNNKSCIKDVPIDLSKITKRHTVIFVWYKDELGNICVHNLTYPGDTNQNWFTTEASKGTDADISDLTGEGSAFVYPTASINTIGLNGHGIDDNSNESSGSRVTQLFNSVANVFARNSEVTADTSVTEKPADVAKKAAKKAKKSAKKAGKKASGKAVAAEKPLMAVETAEILEQTLTTSAPEITGATESVVNEIAQITENVQGQSEVITGLAPAASAETETEVQAENQTVAEAETDAGGKKSSKSSIIVIMLAFLSSFGGVWYYQKGRKL